MSVPFEKELENVARELSKQEERWFDENGQPQHMDMVVRVLREKLLPLLQAGQAMRDTDELYDTVGDADKAWDAARERLAQLEKR